MHLEAEEKIITVLEFLYFPGVKLWFWDYQGYIWYLALQLISKIKEGVFSRRQSLQCLCWLREQHWLSVLCLCSFDSPAVSRVSRILSGLRATLLFPTGWKREYDFKERWRRHPHRSSTPQASHDLLAIAQRTQSTWRIARCSGAWQSIQNRPPLPQLGGFCCQNPALGEKLHFILSWELVMYSVCVGIQKQAFVLWEKHAPRDSSGALMWDQKDFRGRRSRDW